MRIDAIEIGHIPPDDVNVIVEVPLGGQPIKYEMDKDAGTLVVDRFLYTPMSYPGNYGFVPHTLSEDGDPIDVLVANSRPLVPGCVIACRPIGVLVMEDEKGQDEKVIAVHEDDPEYSGYRHINELPDHRVAQLREFFRDYKKLEGKKTDVKEFLGPDAAIFAIRKSMEAYRALRR